MSKFLLEHVAAALPRHRLAGRPGLLAVSGGPDSVALAWLCVQLGRQGRLADVTLAHLNHQLRGPDSDADEDFVRELPRSWNASALEVVTHRIDVAALARQTGDNLENAARNARYAWLTQVAQARGAAWVATGHSADDQAETVLHHFLRGSGPSGLSGMPECRPLGDGIMLVRPLLTQRRQALLDCLRAEGIGYRQDASNQDRRFLRNRLRHELLPLLAGNYNPALVDVLGRTSLQMAELQAHVSAQAAALLEAAERPRAGAIVVLDRATLQGAPRLVAREVFRLIWQREAWPMGEMNFDDWERLLELASGTATGTDFPGGVQARRAGKVVQIERRSPA